jgi:chorismate synthase
MSGNVFGVLFRVTTWGESHGPAVGAVVEGCPPAIPLTEQDIQKDLKRRRPGILHGTSPRKEADQVEILSGTFEGRTTGTPISLLIRNKDADSGAYDLLKDVFRPGHGDYTYTRKYGFRDYRGGGRASARETAARVAAGAIARKVIGLAGMTVKAYTLELGGIRAETLAMEEVGKNAFYCPDPQAALEMEKKLRETAQAGDSLGGIVEIIAHGCPPGLGEPVFDKMDADLAKALMSIGSVKGVEIGAGFAAARLTGSECNDPLTQKGFFSNNAGGILAGITNGEALVIRVACKPIPSIRKEQQTINLEGKPVTLSIQGRHDVSVIPRIIPVCEAMVSLVLADHFLRQKAVWS